MRGLIVLCLATVALAAPQYNYQQQGGFSGQSSGIAPVAQPLPQLAPAPAPQPAPVQVAPQPAPLPAPQAPATYNKQFYIHSAPEEAIDEGAASAQQSASLSRSLRVVIVKAPENKGLENAALQLAKSASDQQTAIYVLNKQTDLGELQQKLSQIQDQSASKPEVHFVKYKTPEEAQYAQQAIQTQYNSLPGPSQVSDEGEAPVENYAGSVGSSAPQGGLGQGGLGQGGLGQGGFSESASNPAAIAAPAVQSTYLPAVHRF